MVTGVELAKALGVSRQRVHQYVTSGKLEGCYTGSGNQRRYDLSKCANALGKRLDAGQMMGNGAGTRSAIKDISGDGTHRETARRSSGAGAEPLASNDPDRYEMARIQKAEEEARKLRRQNAEAEGLYVLASEAAMQASRLVAQEISEFETVLRDGARMIADKLGVDFKTARKILVDTWRAHRSDRAETLEEQSEAATLSDVEQDEDI